MDANEMYQDARFANNAAKIDKYIDAGFSRETRKTVTNYAIAGGLAFALPLFGLDNIIYAVILWSMYASIARKAGKAFGSNVTKNFIGAFVVNIIVASVIEFAASLIPVAGFIIAFVVGYLSIKISGMAYLKVLEKIHHGQVRERYDFNRAMKGLPN